MSYAEPRSGDRQRGFLPPDALNFNDVSYRVTKWNETYLPNAAMLRHILVTEGYAVFQWGDIPGATYANHKHDEDQSHWVVSGCLELTIQGYGVIQLEAGDRDYMPAHTYHSARVIGDVPLVYLVGEKMK